MSKPWYVRPRKGRVWHLAEWPDAEEQDCDPLLTTSCMWTLCGVTGAAITQAPSRVCKRCLKAAQKEVDYLEAALSAAREEGENAKSS